MGKLSFKDFIESKQLIGIHVSTFAQCQTICDKAKQANLWGNPGLWASYKENTVYFNDGHFADIEYCESRNIIFYEYDQIDLSK